TGQAFGRNVIGFSQFRRRFGKRPPWTSWRHQHSPVSSTMSCLEPHTCLVYLRLIQSGRVGAACARRSLPTFNTCRHRRWCFALARIRGPRALCLVYSPLMTAPLKSRREESQDSVELVPISFQVTPSSLSISFNRSLSTNPASSLPSAGVSVTSSVEAGSVDMLGRKAGWQSALGCKGEMHGRAKIRWHLEMARSLQ